jgi:hydroxycarboxylate dehydrogenase B
MPRLDPKVLADFASRIFEANDLPPDVAHQVADSLVLANLSGHDSHGVIRIIEYVDWTKRGWVNPHGTLSVVREQPCILILDGDFGFGQVIGRRAMELGIAKAKAEGACVLSLKRSGHLGRIGEFMEQAVEAGIVCFAFTNTHGAGVLVAPHGGCQRRLSANPLGGGGNTRLLIFGRVVEGMEVVDQIAAGPAGGQNGDTALEPVAMTRVSVQRP